MIKNADDYRTNDSSVFARIMIVLILQLWFGAAILTLDVLPSYATSLENKMTGKLWHLTLFGRPVSVFFQHNSVTFDTSYPVARLPTPVSDRFGPGVWVAPRTNVLGLLYFDRLYTLENNSQYQEQRSVSIRAVPCLLALTGVMGALFISRGLRRGLVWWFHKFLSLRDLRFGRRERRGFSVEAIPKHRETS